MRVKMAYTIDLEDIPNEAKKLITEVIDWQEDLTDILANMQRVDADYFKLGEQARLKLTKIDARLEDCINIIAGYNDAIAKLNAPQEQEASSGEEVQEG
tara:strand:+ start:475 stop:771 length:297 start_codon:yes stop_codon:yes gene_type:complete